MMSKIELQALELQIARDKTLIRVLEKFEKVLDSEIEYIKKEDGEDLIKEVSKVAKLPFWGI